MSKPILFNAYAALSLPTHDVKNRWIERAPAEIRSAVVRTIAERHPLMAKHGHWEVCKDALLAGLVLLGDERERHDKAVRDGGLYAAEPRELGLGEEDDPIVWLVEYALTHGNGGEVCDVLPAFIPRERLLFVSRLGIDEALTDAIEEIENAAENELLPMRSRDWAEVVPRWLRGAPVAFGFRAKKWQQQDVIVRGEAKKLTDAERATFGGGEADKPTHRIVLNLRTWLTMGPRERARLVFHELEHYGPEQDEGGNWRVKKRRHDVEEFTLTIGIFGPASKEAVELVVAGASHPETPKLARTWEAVLDERGQSLLFEMVRR